MKHDNIEGVIRDLASQFAKSARPDYTPVQLVKGVVTGFDSSGPPPTVSVTLSGDTTAIDGVRYLEGYTPTIGDVVAISKQGPDVLILNAYAQGAGGWTTATLSSGFTHNGDSQGNVQYRLVWDNGSLKMQWQGCAARSANITMINALSSTFRPSAKRKVTTSRGWGGGLPSIQVIFNTDGTVLMEGYAVTISDSGHVHSLSSGSTGSTTVNSTSTPPDWVSFHGVEYFL